MNMTWTWLRRKRVWSALAITSCLIAIITHLPLSTWLPAAQSWIASQGIWAFPTFIAIYIVAAVFGLPNIVLILAAGPLFGMTEGVISASIADTLSIAACFVIGQTVGRRWITNAVKDNSRFHKLDRAFAEKGWKIVLLTRLSPVLPSNILNYGFSITRINFWEYIFFSWLGMLPVIFTYVYVSTFGANILSQQSEHPIFQMLGLAATVGVMFYTTKLAASALSTEERGPEAKSSAGYTSGYVYSATQVPHRQSQNRASVQQRWTNKTKSTRAERLSAQPAQLALQKFPAKR